MIAVTLSIELVLLTGVGIFAKKLNIVGPGFESSLSKFLLNIALPAMIFMSVKDTQAFSTEIFQVCATAFAAGAATLAISLGIGQILYLAAGKNARGRLLRYGLSFCNFNFIGFPVIIALFGATGSLYYVFFLVPIRAIYYAIPKALLSPPDAKQTSVPTWAKVKGAVLNPCTIAVIIGFVFWIAEIPVPQIPNYCIGQLSAMSPALGLILCGISLGNYKLSSVLRIRHLLPGVLRCIALPALFFLLTRMLHGLGVDTVLCNIIVVYSALPLPSLLAVYIIQYDPDSQFEAAGAIVISMLLTAVTIPVWYLLLS